jgi:hypothetical protein
MPEPLDLDAIRAAEAAATPGPWEARWAEPADEPERFAAAIRLSIEHDAEGDTASTAWRLIATEVPEDEWLNLGFMGNGSSSAANTAFIAGARSWVPALVAEVERLRQYAQHLRKCPARSVVMVDGVEVTCTCGLGSVD